jgi:KDO2-lipid IV(A) lauroyltransferase
LPDIDQLNVQERLEYVSVRLLVALLGALPRSWARGLGAAAGGLAFALLGRLRRVGLRNLELAYPGMPASERARLLGCLYRNLGWQLAEFAQMGRYTSTNTAGIARYEGLEHYLAARDAGHGVLVVTGHLGVWELSSFYHSLMGHPMSMVIRRLDNPLVDAFVNRLRCLHGNQVLDKDFVRGLLQAMRDGQTVGILMDTNMTPPQGVFVPFFGIPACTASGLARVALKTRAAVLPGFMLWEPAEKKYVLRFGERIPLIESGDDEADVVANTAQFTAAIEDTVRDYPDQWLWLHRRWKTRPAGEPAVY